MRTRGRAQPAQTRRRPRVQPGVWGWLAGEGRRKDGVRCASFWRFHFFDARALRRVWARVRRLIYWVGFVD